MPAVLVADDEASLQYAFRRFFEEAGWEVESVSSGRRALKALAARVFDCLFLDVRLPDADGLELIRDIRRIRPAIPIIVMTAYGSLETAVRAADSQILEYFVKPVDLDRALELADGCLRSTVRESGPSDESVASQDQFIGNTTEMQRVFRNIGLFADSDATVLVTGETGTGKEMVARALHGCSGRRKGPFIAVNCGALPEQLVESELFGYTKGAFTGATESRGGRFEAAESGTLFLDEVAELPLATQVKILRFLDNQTVERLGSVEPIRVDTRVIAATNRDLSSAVAGGAFRQDLYYRLAVMQIVLPPLRERKGDIQALAESFIREFSRGSPPALGGETLRVLENHDWPGNVRELRNAMQHAAVIARGGVILPSHLPVGLQQPDLPNPRLERDDALTQYLDCLVLETGKAMDQAVGPVETELVRRALNRFNGNQSAAATFLGVHRNTLRKKLRRLA